jgi:hypothetical protein
MSFNPADYDQEVYEDRMGITARRQAECEELAREEREEREARQMEFLETPLCTDACFVDGTHASAECAALAAMAVRRGLTEGDLIQAWLDGAPDAVLAAA